MVYTVTLNPAIDYIVQLDSIKLGEINRVDKEYLFAGGKGLNVSMVLKKLDIDSIALGFIAGFTGIEIKNKLLNIGCRENFINLKNGNSRINVKIKADIESEINGSGPTIEQQELKSFFDIINTLKYGDILVLAGSVPSSLQDDIYKQICILIKGKGVKIVLDTTKNLLLNVLEYKPFLIKPNKLELEELFSAEINTNDEIIYYAKKLQEKGAKNVLISMAGDGAILVKENGEHYFRQAPKGRVKNSVGAGDSMVAGFLAGYIKTGDMQEAFKLGVAAGSATAFNNDLADRADVEIILNTL